VRSFFFFFRSRSVISPAPRWSGKFPLLQRLPAFQPNEYRTHNGNLVSPSLALYSLLDLENSCASYACAAASSLVFLILSFSFHLSIGLCVRSRSGRTPGACLGGNAALAAFTSKHGPASFFIDISDLGKIV
jgi:hypothetical protein